MTEQAKPTYEQLEMQLQDTQHAMRVALDQRTAAMNQVVDASTALNRMALTAQALQHQLVASQAQVADLEQKLASRAVQRAGKRK